MDAGWTEGILIYSSSMKYDINTHTDTQDVSLVIVSVKILAD